MSRKKVDVNEKISNIELKLSGLEVFEVWETLKEYKCKNVLPNRSANKVPMMLAELLEMKLSNVDTLEQAIKEEVISDVREIANIRNKLIVKCSNKKCKRYTLDGENPMNLCEKHYQDLKEERKEIRRLINEYKKYRLANDFEGIKEMRKKHGDEVVDELWRATRHSPPMRLD